MKAQSVKKEWLTPEEAVQEGFFASMQTAANLRHMKRGPRYYRPNKGRVVYNRSDLEKYVQRGLVLTDEHLPLDQH